MYGKGVGGSSVATGAALLPATGENRLVFVVAATLLAAGVVTFVVSSVIARKHRVEA
jgi:hypothetical protein